MSPPGWRACAKRCREASGCRYWTYFEGSNGRDYPDDTDPRARGRHTTTWDGGKIKCVIGADVPSSGKEDSSMQSLELGVAIVDVSKPSAYYLIESHVLYVSVEVT